MGVSSIMYCNIHYTKECGKRTKVLFIALNECNSGDFHLVYNEGIYVYFFSMVQICMYYIRIKQMWVKQLEQSRLGDEV